MEPKIKKEEKKIVIDLAKEEEEDKELIELLEGKKSKKSNNNNFGKSFKNDSNIINKEIKSASQGVSPGSIFPPMNSQCPPCDLPTGRRPRRNLPPRRMMPPTTSMILSSMV